jgi:magnesium-transporting ATPase (P-type)
MKQFMVLQYLENFSPILKGETDNIDDAITLRDVLARMNPKDKFIIVQVMDEECNGQVAVCNDTTF